MTGSNLGTSSPGLLARRRLRAWILRRGERDGWRDGRVPAGLAWAGRRLPGATECLHLAGLMHLGAGRAAEAVRSFDEAVSRGLGGWSSLRFDLGMALMACGDFPRAAAEFREACRLTGDAPWARYGLERCRLMAGLVEQVAEHIEATDAVEAAEPGNGPVFEGRLRHVIPVLPDREVDALRAVVAHRPRAMRARLYLAHVEAGQGRVAAGVALLSEVARHRWPQWASRAGIGASPHFLIIGQTKAGTSSLFEYLCAHPQVVAPLTKEIHFWSRAYQAVPDHRYGMDWYRAFFPPLPADAGLITGEASPSYFLDAAASRRIADHLPEARLIVLLRDPVERAYSAFRMNERLELEYRSFEEIVARELDRTPTCPLAPGEIPGGHLTVSAALPHLRRWLAQVPRERLLILQNRDLADDLPGVMARACRHLGIAPFVPTNPRRYNEGIYPPMPEALERQLRAWFAEHERALAEFLAGEPGAQP